MTRIVAGTLGGRTIAVPPKGTRPTSERVREALFSRLEHGDRLAGARVIDLFAGSGALGIEAASRGAVAVRLVDAVKQAAAVCQRNVTSLGLHGRVEVVTDRAERPAALAAAEPWDLALVDPPYDLPEDTLTQVLVALAPVMATDGLVVVERSARSGEPAWPDGWGRDDRRAYGETVLWFATPQD